MFADLPIQGVRTLVVANDQNDIDFAKNASAVVITSDDHARLRSLESNSMDSIAVCCALSSDVLREVFRLLVGGGTLAVRAPQDINMDLLFAGFEQISSRNGEAYAKKPSWEVGSVAKLNRPQQAKPPEKVVWNLGADDLADDDIELEDEDELLKREVEVVPVKLAAKREFDCGTSAGPVRKACKNCVCGLKEEIEKDESAALKQPPASGCGSCSLGDAFRCSTCPYLGMPAFKPGEAVKLAL